MIYTYLLYILTIAPSLYPTSGMLLRREVRETLGRFACDGGTGRPAAAAAAATAGRAVVLALVVVLAVVAAAAAAAAAAASPAM